MTPAPEFWLFIGLCGLGLSWLMFTTADPTDPADPIRVPTAICCGCFALALLLTTC